MAPVTVLFMLLLIRPGGAPPPGDQSGWHDRGHAIASWTPTPVFTSSVPPLVPLIEHAVVTLVSAAALTWTAQGLVAGDLLIDRMVQRMWTFLMGGAGLLATLLATCAWFVMRLVLDEIRGIRRSLT
jgi:hypothetical protein